VEYVASTIERLLGEAATDIGEGMPKSRLFLISTYVIGKERLLLEVRGRCCVGVLGFGV
jgi:hypothetical protein